MAKVPSINVENLKIARKNMGFDTLSVSKGLTSSKKDVVLLWESGEDLPTWSQLKTIAKKYNISELLLLSKKKIEKNKNIPDFRVGVDEEDKGGVKKIINLVINRQHWTESVFKSKGYSKNKLLGKGHNINNPIELANLISKELEIDIEEIKNISGSNAQKKTLAYLIQKAENKGIFVGKTISYHRIPVQQMRGMFISNDYCPFIILNRRDSVSAQIFSFIHELSHLFRRSESISNSIDFRDSNKKINPEETFCNKVAINLLLPKEDFVKSSYTYEDIVSIADTYKLSMIAIFYRLKELNKIISSTSKELEDRINKELADNIKNKEKNKKSGGNFYNSMVDSNGNLFNKIVIGAYFEGGLNNVEASRLLRFSPEKYV